MGAVAIIARMAQHGRNNIKIERERRGLTQEALAALTRCGPSTIQKLEAGRIPLTLIWMQRIAAALGCTARDLIPEEEPTAVRVARPYADKARLIATVLEHGELRAALEIVKGLEVELAAALSGADQ
ncbi:helix-turn-helix transcriptional regulator [Nitrospirillum viridazoti]|uniref:HTH cro/C1-type domain-containing protein n=1 Tax=Nitrospirillum viridazoti CBAmc TaxID=1441467 RepID=A0A248JRK8_9PROT|nr:helix-turn-helix transcriptional regulator [Nitrospirillum amazonense]ASG21383.1 hypothetical protein Y958_11510 [Nitrospirillum amazonense CBAmc]